MSSGQKKSSGICCSPAASAAVKASSSLSGRGDEEKEEKKYYALGFGSNYFYLFGKDITPLHLPVVGGDNTSRVPTNAVGTATAGSAAGDKTSKAQRPDSIQGKPIEEGGISVTPNEGNAWILPLSPASAPRTTSTTTTTTTTTLSPTSPTTLQRDTTAGSGPHVERTSSASGGGGGVVGEFGRRLSGAAASTASTLVSTFPRVSMPSMPKRRSSATGGMGGGGATTIAKAGDEASSSSSATLIATTAAPPPVPATATNTVMKTHNATSTPSSSFSDSSSNSAEQQRAVAAQGQQQHIVLPFGTATNPITSITCTATATIYTNSTTGDIYQMGTIHGHVYTKPTLSETRLPIKCTQLAAGRRHVLALMERGVVVMSWGAGHFGQLGHGSEITGCGRPKIIERLLPQVVGGHVTHIAAGGLHSGAIVTSSPGITRTFTWGSNRRGQCGVEGGKSHTVPYPTPVVDVTHPDHLGEMVHFHKLALGRLHTVGLTESGEVYTWGSCTMGRCGHGEAPDLVSGRGRSYVNIPRRVDMLKDVRIEHISAGDGHTLALTGGGRVFSWGCGCDGQLGHGHTMHLLSPRLVGDLDFGGFAVGGKMLRRSLEVEQRSGRHLLNVVPVDSDTVPPETKSEDRLDTGRGKQTGDAGKSEERVTGGDHINLVSSVAVAQDRAGESKDKGDRRENPAPPIYAPSPKRTPLPAPSFKTLPPLDLPLLAPEAPRIVSIYAAGCYSAALSSSGDLYTWGYGDPNQLGHPPPQHQSHLPYVEPGPMSRTGPGNRVRDSRSFDSKLNVLLPRRLECIRDLGLRVEDVAAGPSHMVLLCSTRVEGDDEENEIGKTLYEIESRRRTKGLNRLRTMGSARTLRGGTEVGVPVEDNSLYDGSNVQEEKGDPRAAANVPDGDFAPVEGPIAEEDEGTSSDRGNQNKAIPTDSPSTVASSAGAPVAETGKPTEVSAIVTETSPTVSDTKSVEDQSRAASPHKQSSMRWIRKLKSPLKSPQRRSAKGREEDEEHAASHSASSSHPKMGVGRKVLSAFGGGK